MSSICAEKLSDTHFFGSENSRVYAIGSFDSDIWVWEGEA